MLEVMDFAVVELTLQSLLTPSALNYKSALFHTNRLRCTSMTLVGPFHGVYVLVTTANVLHLQSEGVDVDLVDVSLSEVDSELFLLSSPSVVYPYTYAVSMTNVVVQSFR
jgi:hypothetical protein